MPKTALDLSRKQWRAYEPGKRLKTLQDGEHSLRDKRMDSAMALARAASKLLKQEFGAKKVVLIGSLLNISRFTPWSDIDLAVWGIPSDSFYSAVAAVTGISASFKIDLIDPETCRPALLEVIKKEGVEL